MPPSSIQPVSVEKHAPPKLTHDPIPNVGAQVHRAVVGAREGEAVGCGIGTMLGSKVLGARVAVVGIGDGFGDGKDDGASVDGSCVGAAVGTGDGQAVGAELGNGVDGDEVGALVGGSDGKLVGPGDGSGVGTALGSGDGGYDGNGVGKGVGEGVVGKRVGRCVGAGGCQTSTLAVARMYVSPPVM